MSTRRLTDWKDVANSYYEKAVSLSILLLLFSFLVSPKIDVKPYEAEVRVTEAIEIPPEIRERIEPPQELARPVVEILVEDDLTGDDEDILEIDTIERTTIDYTESVTAPPRVGQTDRFVVYEDPPQAIKRVQPEYPNWAKRANVQGQVVLEVEVLRDGTVGAVEVVRSLMAGLDELAVAAVRQWEFTPAKAQGQPVAVWVTFPVDFRIE
jgi:periplasmic protein TonB